MSDSEEAVVETPESESVKAEADASGSKETEGVTVDAEEVVAGQGSDDGKSDSAVESDASASETNGEDQSNPDENSGVPGVVPASLETPPSPPAPPPAAASGSGVFGMTVGGIIAGAIGFLVATFALPEGWPNSEPSGLEALESALMEQDEKLNSLFDELAAVRDAPPVVQEMGEAPDIAPLVEKLANVEARVTEVMTSVEESFAGLGVKIDGMETRLVELESRPVAPTGPDGSAAMEAQLEAFRQQLDAVTADAEARIAEAQGQASAIEAEAAAAAAAAERTAALSSLRASLDNGSAFADALAFFPDAPDALTSVATQGVPTIASLQTSFPNTAREALSQSQAVSDTASTGERMVAFLKRRTNARSLAPREGDDADAVLSRAEAALGNGDLEGALAELAGLPDASLSAMADWIAAAETRSAAIGAVATLVNATN